MASNVNPPNPAQNPHAPVPLQEVQDNKATQPSQFNVVEANSSLQKLLEKIATRLEQDDRFHQTNPIKRIFASSLDSKQSLSLKITRQTPDKAETLFEGVVSPSEAKKVAVIQQKPDALNILDQYAPYLDSQLGQEVTPPLANITIRLSGEVIFQIDKGKVTVNELQPEQAKEVQKPPKETQELDLAKFHSDLTSFFSGKVSKYQAQKEQEAQTEQRQEKNEGQAIDF